MKLKNPFLIVILFITTLQLSIAQTAGIEKIWIEHNVTHNKLKGMKIHSKFTIQDMQDKRGQFTAWFYHDDGRPLQGTTEGNRTAQGQLAILTTITPKYELAIFNDVWVFIPYDEFSKTLQQNGTYPLQFRVGIHDHNLKQLTLSDLQSFSYTLSNNYDDSAQDQYNVKLRKMTKEDIAYAKKNDLPYIVEQVFIDNTLTLPSTITSTGSKVTPTEAQQALDFHNQARAEVGVSPLTWSVELSRYAQEWAEYLAHSYGCEMMHRSELGKNDKRYGENLAWAKGMTYTALNASESWYSEIRDFKNIGFTLSQGTGHYTQMIWHNTTQVGMGIARCPDGAYMVVANYNPPGNYRGEKAY